MPVYNAGEDVERTIVFSVVEGAVAKKYFTYKEAAEILAHTKGVLPPPKEPRRNSP